MGSRLREKQDASAPEGTYGGLNPEWPLQVVLSRLGNPYGGPLPHRKKGDLYLFRRRDAPFLLREKS
jgi:hypothetical protein